MILLRVQYINTVYCNAQCFETVAAKRVQTSHAKRNWTLLIYYAARHFNQYPHQAAACTLEIKVQISLTSLFP